jgi:hypothetical protein
MVCRKIFLCLILLTLSGFALEPLAQTQDETTPGATILMSTFQSISVKAPFAGDLNANSTAVIQYRMAGTTTWLDAYTPFVDRRATINSAVNPYANQARGSIVGLTADTNYEVQVLWTDADGVSAQPAVGAISTLSYTPPLGGSTITVNSNATLAAALNTVNPGETIHLDPGTYAPFIVTRSGTASGWINIEGDPAGTSIVTGIGVAQSVRLNANFIVLQHLTLGPADSNGIVVRPGRHHVFVQDNTLQDISSQCAANPNAHYGDGGISVLTGANNVFVLRNTVISTSLSNPACLLSPIYASPGAGIQWADGHTFVFQDNVVAGAFRDSVTLDSNAVTENVDIYGNTVSGDYRDDGVESKGANINVRMGGNKIETTGPGGFTCIAGNSNSATILYGPFYIFRNTCRVQNTFALGGTVFKLGGVASYVFHNTTDASQASVRWDGVANISANGFRDLVYINNVMKLSGNAIAGFWDGSLFDYNLYRNTISGINFVRSWNGTTNYATIAGFAAVTGQDAHSKQQDPLFTNSQLQINNASPSLDAGVVLPNFNDSTSAWSFSGVGPDAGAFEVNGIADAMAPSTPTGLSAPTLTASTVNLIWTASTDNVAVAGYRVFRNGAQVGTSTGPSFLDVGLNSLVAYSYTVSAFDAAGNNSGVSTAFSATTKGGAGDTTPPVISAVTSSGITTGSATITWTTNEASDTQVEFGLTTAYGQSILPHATLGTAHSATLVGLASNTTYHYRVKSRDAAQNLAAGGDNSFITAFGISELGAVSRTTDGTGSLDAGMGYGRILSTAGTTPSGLAIFGFRQSGILVTEAGVPDSPLIAAGRTYAEVSPDGVVNTGIAMANSSTQDAVITFEVRNTAGAVLRSGSFTLLGIGSSCTLPVCSHRVAGFLDQAPFFSGRGVQGTFSFTSTVPISVTALRGFYNERSPSDFLITTLPVVNLLAGVTSGTQVIPHFAAGDGWTTQIILVNPTATAQTGNIEFLDPGTVTPPTSGAPKIVSIDGASATSTAYSVAANSSTKFLIEGASPGTASGSVRIVPLASGPVPTPLLIFSYKPQGITVSEAGVPVTMGTTFRMFAQLSSDPQILSGVAIANPTAVAGTVTLTLHDLFGAQIATTNPPLTLPASGQFSGFIDQLIPGLAGRTVQGVLRISTDLSSISVVGLRARYNERLPVADFLITTTPPTLESGVPSIEERVFPHLANGDGYTTQFILFSGTSGQTSGGTLRFIKSDGTLLDLNIH